MERKTVDVIIPVYRPDHSWKNLVDMLNIQTYPVNIIRVMNTGRENWNPVYETWSSKMIVNHVTEDEFDHGATRDAAARMSNADYLLFMTQDAVPKDLTLVECMVRQMQEAAPWVKGKAPAYEHLNNHFCFRVTWREINYKPCALTVYNVL